jgi:antitoxin MazE
MYLQWLYILQETMMRVEIAKWGNSAALRVPARALADAGLQIGQALDLRVEEGRLVLDPAQDILEDLVARITPQNCHRVALDDAAVGAEVW